MRDWSPVLGLPLWVWLFVLPGCLALACGIARPAMARALGPVWRGLDRVYVACGVIAGVFTVVILLLIVAQMICRWAGIAFPGSTMFSGYAMAAASFFALAHALMRGAHIRVSIFLSMNARVGRFLDVLAVTLSAIIATYLARYAVKITFESARFNERTQGQDQIPESVVSAFEMLITAPGDWGALWAATGDGMVYTPVWIPQIAMAAGTTILAVALWDTLTRMLATGRNPIVSEAVE